MKISTMHDLRIAKMQCRHELKLKEHAMQTCIQLIKNDAQESLKKSLNFFAKELAINLAKKILLNGKHKR